MKVNLNISGFDIRADFPDQDIKLIHKPLVEKFSRLYREKQERIVIFLCAPPGSGKSTLAAFWEYLSQKEENIEPLQVLPFDGFHYPNELLDEKTVVRNGETVTLRSIKGAFETFNLSELIRKLKQLKSGNPKWPYYDRNLHDPVDDAISVEKNIVVVEGNYLLLNEPVWEGLNKLADFTIFVDAQAELLQERLIDRKIRGGSSPQEALDFYNKSDAINIDVVLNHSVAADLSLSLNSDDSFEIS